MTDRLFQRPTVFTADPDATTAWTIEGGYNRDDRAIILGGDMWRGNDGIIWRLRATSPFFKDAEHDSSHLIDLEIAGVTLTGGYSDLGFEGYLVQGSWYNDPENLSLNTMALEHDTPWDKGWEPKVCAQSYCEGLPQHVLGAQYMAPKQEFEPRRIRFDHGPVRWYALAEEDDPTTWDRSTETLFWHKVQDAAKGTDREIWSRTPNTNWSPR